MKGPVALLMAIASLALVAADKEEPKPNTLTPEEAAEGWLLLFDGQTAFGWSAHAKETDKKPDVTVSDGVLALAGRDTYLDLTTRFHFFEIKFDYRVEGPGPDYFCVDCSTGDRKREALVEHSLDGFNGPGWARVTCRFGPVDVSSRVDYPSGGSSGGKQELPKANRLPLLQFSPNHSTDSKLFLRNIKLKPLDLKAIFNGKDLTGWKEIPGKRSVFSVTDKGELNVKNGPGDLQTEGQWDDFVLQLDCISNGDHLNSGVFFRCLPDQFWSGYEAQVRNQWQGDDRAKPIDYGTGGIYNRQPARKVVSSDREWFTLTVVANGNHLATWVNGYQTTDFTDKRPTDKSARKGTKTDKGPISLQGHDKTTDLSFRNLRIAELPRHE